MSGENEAADRVVAALDAAYQADPEAMHALFSHRVPCNEALANDPHVQVSESASEPGSYSVGVIGIVNGVLSALGVPVVAGTWSEADGDGHRTLVGFARYSPPPGGPSQV